MTPTNPPQYSIELTLSTLMLAVMRLRNTYKYDEVAPKPFNDEMDIAYHKAQKELNQLIYTQVLELIASDELKPTSHANKQMLEMEWRARQIRNHYRAELRAKARAKYIGGSDV